MREIRDSKYTVKAYYIDNDLESIFWCKEIKIGNITNEMGVSMPMGNGEHMLETNSGLDFKIEQEVRIGDNQLGIFNINQVVDNKDQNSLRGKPRYITTLMIK